MLNFFDEVLQEQQADGSAVLERGVLRDHG